MEPAGAPCRIPLRCIAAQAAACVFPHRVGILCDKNMAELHQHSEAQELGQSHSRAERVLAQRQFEGNDGCRWPSILPDVLARQVNCSKLHRQDKTSCLMLAKARRQEGSSFFKAISMPCTLRLIYVVQIRAIGKVLGWYGRPVRLPAGPSNAPASRRHEAGEAS